MKNSMINFFAAMMLVVSGVAMADIDCTPAMNSPNDQGQTYNTQACVCIWTNIYNGCMAHPGGNSRICGRSLYNQLKVASDANINTLYCGSGYATDKQGCIDSLDYYRTSGTGQNYSAHNCPCTDGTCQ